MLCVSLHWDLVLCLALFNFRVLLCSSLNVLHLDAVQIFGEFVSSLFQGSLLSNGIVWICLQVPSNPCLSSKLSCRSNFELVIFASCIQFAVLESIMGSCWIPFSVTVRVVFHW